ncbi:MAG: substrate-binding domain-containing protein, partial [Lentisphaerae bacterium]|nr:substrate-binding domain-containing protein [Lentisphaerota bacterium]
PKGITGIGDFARGDLQIGLGKAQACAIGSVSASLLEEAGLGDTVDADFEALTVNRLANQVKLKALDAAIVWDATALQYADSVDAVPIEGGDFHAVPLAIGVLKGSGNTPLASEFAEFAAGEFAAASFRENHYQVPGKRLRVGCGSSMRPPVEDLAALFERETGCEVLRDYGGSGTVLLQIQESKEGDVYICHDPYAYVCEERGLSKRWDTMAYVEPALAVSKGNPKGIQGLGDLLRTDIEPGLPHRERSTRGVILWEMFRKGGMAEAMAQRKFFESRTHDLVNQLKLGAVDVAVLWDAPVKAMPEFEVVPIEEKYRVDAVTSATTGRTYSLERVKVTAVQLTFSREPLLAAQFVRICLSDKGRAVLAKHHFSLP